MTRLSSAAPFGALGLEFGNTTVKPYSKKRPHQGQDVQWRLLSPIKSRETYTGVAGEIIAAYNDGAYRSGWGNYVEILIPSATHRIVRRLAHHKTGSVQVRVGQRVTAASRVGTMGNTGEAPGGVHLHDELWINGVRVDPMYYFTHDLPGTPGWSSGGDEPFVPPRPTYDEGDDMLIIRSTSASADKLILNDRSFIAPAGQPLAIMSADEKGAYDWWAERGIPYRLVTWSGDQIRALIKTRGIYAFDPNSGRTDYSKITY